jgi:hypothetical protein
MRTYFIGSILVVVVAIGISSVILAQTRPGPRPDAAKGTPDLSGIWNREPVPNAADVLAQNTRGISFLGFINKPPMQPWAMEAYQANRKGLADRESKGQYEADPRNSCFPPGPTRIFTDPSPFEIRQTPDVVYILSESDHWVRRIYTDGREHPDGYPVTWMGFSLGKYDGNSLVVDTTDINDKTWIDTLGHPHSDALHLVERIRRVNHETLEIQFTFDDRKAYTKTWTAKKVYQLQPPGYEMKQDVICEEYRKPGLRKEGFEFIKQ